MIEVIQVAATDAAQATGAARPQATAYEVGQFAQAYANGGVANSAAAPSVAQPQAPSQIVEATGAFFGKLNSGAEKINALSAEMTTADDKTLPGKMLEMTFACHLFLFESQLTSNVANRTSDGIQQLFRQQS